ncbi:protein GVQW3 [Trichonephila clavipes]|nr:protein GVQW3 [Trichonephila clavipes]
MYPIIEEFRFPDLTSSQSLQKKKILTLSEDPFVDILEKRWEPPGIPVCGSECLSRARVFEGFKRFKDGRQDVEDDSWPGRPSTSKTDENVEKVASLIRPDRRLSIRAIAETVNIDKECVRKILHDNLNMQKVCAKMVPKILTFEQQATRKNVCTDILDAIKNDPNLLKRNCWEQWTREGTHALKTGSGATRKTTRKEYRRIVRQALVDPTVTRSTIPADVGVAIVLQIISRHLAEANLKSKRPFRALPLTPEHR